MIVHLSQWHILFTSGLSVYQLCACLVQVTYLVCRCMELLSCHPTGSSGYYEFVVVSALIGMTLCVALFSSLLDYIKISCESISLSTVLHLNLSGIWLVQIITCGNTPSYLCNAIDYVGRTQSSLEQTTLDCQGKPSSSHLESQLSTCHQGSYPRSEMWLGDI